MRALVRASGVIAAGGPLLSLIGGWLHPGWLELATASPAQAWPVWALWAASVLVTVGGLALRRARDLGRNLVVLGIGLWVIQGIVPNLPAPSVALAALTIVVLTVHILYPAVPASAASVQDAISTGEIERARAGCGTALAGWPIVWLGGIPLDRGVALAHAGALVVATLLVARASSVRGFPRWARAIAVPVALAMTAALGLGLMRPVPALAFLSVVPLAGASLRSSEQRLIVVIVDVVASQPARLLAVTFLGMSAVGAMLLRLPLASAGDEAIHAIDAAFTATSAVCVNGLAVIDNATHLSLAGQVIILTLIQLGGLGIMSFSTAAIAALGRRLSLRHEAAMAALLSGDRSDLFRAIRRLLIVTFGSEILGALALTACFRLHGDSIGTAAWRGAFTAISAFCNAGIALQSDSLIAYASDPVVLNVVSVLVILGGLSPAVVASLPGLLRGRALSLQSRIVLTSTGALLAFGFVMILALEWSYSFANLSWADRVDAAWFQSVTLRSAGFNSVDFTQLQPATLWFMLALMFIGGSPGGTAGGVKTTTVAVLLLAVRGAMRGQWEATIAGRKLAKKTFYEAATIVTVAGLFVFTGVTALSVTQTIPLEQCLLEVVSALATVGISVGTTARLDDVGKIIIMLCMFVGRIGPLTLFMFLRERQAQDTWRLPETEVDVG